MMRRKDSVLLIMISWTVLSFLASHFTFVPSTLWLAIPAATDPVFLLAFLLQPPLETSFTLALSWQNIFTFLVRIVLFPSLSTAFHDAPFSL